ncbi:MAG: sugar O-acyltransferase [Bacteroidales bacterium]
METRNVLIIGGEGHGAVVESCIEDNHKHGKDLDIQVRGYVNDYVNEIDGYPVLGGTNNIAELAEKGYFFIWGIHLIGRNVLTYSTYQRINIPKERLVTVIHHSAFIGRNVTIGPGSLVMCNSYIAPRTQIGESTMIKANTCIGHDVVCGPCCHFAMHSSTGSYASLGICANVAVNSVVLEKVHIGNFAMLGAHSLAHSNIPDYEIYAGSPAKFLKHIKE